MPHHAARQAVSRELTVRAPVASPRDLDALVTESTDALDMTRVQLDYWRREELAILDRFIAPSIVSRMRDEVYALRTRVKRKAVWGYKSAGSLAASVLVEEAPTVTALYQSPALIELLSTMAERPLHVCPANDPHALAVYWYEQPGDRVGFHYDTSHYVGARYTVLIGIVDDSSALLQCRVYSRERRRAVERIDVHTTPGKLVFFNGDKLHHAVSPIAANEERIVLSLQYVTDPRMSTLRRALSTVKDSLTYFGLDALKPSKIPSLPTSFTPAPGDAEPGK